MVKVLSYLAFFALGMTATHILWTAVVYAIPVPNAYINFARPGGDFSSRTVTFAVPEKDTTTLAQDGLRLYEIHLAKMIEVTNEFCKEQKDSYVIHWNYELEDRKVFMGKYSFSCQFVKDTVKEFGTSGVESIEVHQAGKPTVVKIAPLNLRGKNVQQFSTLVQFIKPVCIQLEQRICPGHRWE